MVVNTTYMFLAWWVTCPEGRRVYELGNRTKLSAGGTNTSPSQNPASYPTDRRLLNIPC